MSTVRRRTCVAVTWTKCGDQAWRLRIDLSSCCKNDFIMSDLQAKRGVSNMRHAYDDEPVKFHCYIDIIQGDFVTDLRIIGYEKILEGVHRWVGD
jgi:hypothetical protein